MANPAGPAMAPRHKAGFSKRRHCRGGRRSLTLARITIVGALGTVVSLLHSLSGTSHWGFTQGRRGLAATGRACSSKEFLRDRLPGRTALLAMSRFEQLKAKCIEHGLPSDGDEADLDQRLNKWLDQSMRTGEIRKPLAGTVSARLQLALGRRTSAPVMPRSTAKPAADSNKRSPQANRTGSYGLDMDKSELGRTQSRFNAQPHLPTMIDLAVAEQGSRSEEDDGGETGSMESVATASMDDGSDTGGIVERKSAQPSESIDAGRSFSRPRRTRQRREDAHQKFEEMRNDVSSREQWRAQWAYSRAKRAQEEAQEDDDEAAHSRNVAMWEETFGIPTDQDKVEFGQHKGITYDELWKKNPEYCRSVHRKPIHTIQNNAGMVRLKAYLLRHSKVLGASEEDDEDSLEVVRNDSSIIDFGHLYRGETYKEVFRRDKTFCEWILLKFASSTPPPTSGMANFVQWLEKKGFRGEERSSNMWWSSERLTFGKYEGERVDKVLEKDPRWCQLMLRRVKQESYTSPRHLEFAETMERYINSGHEDDIVGFGKHRGEATYKDILGDFDYSKWVVSESRKHRGSIEMWRLAKFLEDRGFNTHGNTTVVLAIEEAPDVAKVVHKADGWKRRGWKDLKMASFVETRTPRRTKVR